MYNELLNKLKRHKEEIRNTVEIADLLNILEKILYIKHKTSYNYIFGELVWHEFQYLLSCVEDVKEQCKIKIIKMTKRG